MLNDDSYVSAYSTPSTTAGDRSTAATTFVSAVERSSLLDASGCSQTSLSRADNCSCTVVSSGTGKVPPGRKYVQVHTLTGHTITLAVDSKCKLADVFTTVVVHVGIKDTDSRVFGLASKVNDNEYRFHLDLSVKLSKIAPKQWRKSNSSESPDVGLNLYLRILLYVDHISLISCPTTLLHYYCQLRHQSRTLWTDADSIPEDKCWEMAALALQADYGDYDSFRYKQDYFTPHAYFPLWVLNVRGVDYVLRHMPAMHMDLRGVDRHEARLTFCNEASRPPHNLNMHLFWLKKLKNGVDNMLMAVATKGLHFFESNPDTGQRWHISAYSWGNIAKLAFEKRKFTLVGLGDAKKLTLWTRDDDTSRYLLAFCKKVHQCNMALLPEVHNALHKEFIDGHRFRESYIYSDRTDLEMVTKFEQFMHHHASQPCSPTVSMTNGVIANGYSTLLPGYTSQHSQLGGQRVSVVSDASSNTTSGIVSDRQQTHTDSEMDTNEEGCSSGFTPSPLAVSEMSLSYPRLDGPATNYVLMHKLDNMTNAHAFNQGFDRCASTSSRSQCPPSVSDKTMTGDSEADTVSAVDRNIDDDFDWSSSRKESTRTEDDRLLDLQRAAAETISLSIGSLLADSQGSLRSRASACGSDRAHQHAKSTSTTIQVQHSRDNSTASRASGLKVNIDELRHRTLNITLDSPGFIVEDMPTSGVGMADESTQTNLPDTSNIMPKLPAPIVAAVTDKGKEMKSLSTQTGGVYYSCYKEEDKKGRMRRDHKAYRIVNAHRSTNDQDTFSTEHINGIATHALLPADALGPCTSVAPAAPDHLIIDPPAYAMRRKGATPLVSPNNNVMVSNGDWYSGQDCSIYQHLTSWRSGLMPSSSSGAVLAPTAQKLPQYCGRQTHSLQNLNAFDIRNPPAYNDAVLQQHMRVQQMAHTSGATGTRRQHKKRWTTVCGVDEQMMQQAALLGQLRQPPPYPTSHAPLQQATSEPGIAQAAHCLHSDLAGPGRGPSGLRQPPPYPSYTSRSVSSTQIPSLCLDHVWPTGMQPNGDECQLVYGHASSSNKTDSKTNLSRVRSMPGTANCVDRKMQQVVAPPAYTDAMSSEQHCAGKHHSTASTNKNKYCKSCQKLHTGGTVKMNIGQIKAMLENHNVPMLTALCNETAVEHRGAATSNNNDSWGRSAHLPSSPRATNRPISWHENQDLSTMPPNFYHTETATAATPADSYRLDSNSNFVSEICGGAVGPVPIPVPSSPPHFSSTPNLSALDMLLPPPPPYATSRCNDSAMHMTDYERYVQRNQTTVRNAV